MDTEQNLTQNLTGNLTESAANVVGPARREKLEFKQIANSTQILTAIANSATTRSRYSVTPDRIRTALESRNVVELRNISQHFFYTSGEYRRLVKYAAQLLTFDYLIVPRVDNKLFKKPAFNKSFLNVMNYIQNAAIEENGYDIALAVVRDGIYFGYEQAIGGNSSTFLKLPTDYCRTRYKINGVYQIEFDNKYFDAFRTEADKIEAFAGFPPEFEKAYNAYLKNSELRWVPLDPQFARAHLIDDAIPMFSSVFMDILELDEYKTLDKTKLALSTYTLLVQKIPLNKDNELALYMEEIVDLHQNARKMIKNPSIDVLTTPCDMEPITLDSGANSRVERDNIERATNMIYNSAGTPIALFNAGSGTGSIGLNLSVKVDESLMFPLLRQFEKWYNNKLAELSPSFEFGIVFPPITVFNYTERVKEYKDAATYGFPTKLLALAALGIRQFDANFLLNYENELLELSTRMQPLSSSHTSSGDVETGRPESEEPLSDEGDRARDDRTNDDRAKE